ncbi:MAG: hypothetical protein AB7D29_07580 [Campylobacterales bacterium]
MSILELFKESGYSIKGYAAKNKLDYETLKKVLHGIYEGKRKGQARECVEALYRDGLLPPQHPMHSKIAEVA